MIKNSDFELINISDEHLAIPIGEEATRFHGVVALSETAAYLLQEMNKTRTKAELVEILLREYQVDRITAENDVNDIIKKFAELNLILDD